MSVETLAKPEINIPQEADARLAYSHIAQELLGERNEEGQPPSEMAGILAEYLEDGVVHALQSQIINPDTDPRSIDHDPTLTFFDQSQRAVEDGSLITHLQAVLEARKKDPGVHEEGAIAEKGIMGQLQERRRLRKEAKARAAARPREIENLKRASLQERTIQQRDLVPGDEITMTLISGRKDYYARALITGKVDRIDDLGENGTAVVIKNIGDKRDGPREFASESLESAEELVINGCTHPMNDYRTTQGGSDKLVQGEGPVIFDNGRRVMLSETRHSRFGVDEGPALQLDQLNINGENMFPKRDWELAPGDSGIKIRR